MIRFELHTVRHSAGWTAHPRARSLVSLTCRLKLGQLRCLWNV